MHLKLNRKDLARLVLAGINQNNRRYQGTNWRTVFESFNLNIPEFAMKSDLSIYKGRESVIIEDIDGKYTTIQGFKSKIIDEFANLIISLKSLKSTKNKKVRKRSRNRY